MTKTALLPGPYDHLNWVKTVDDALTLPALQAARVRRHADRERLVAHGERLSYAEADRRSALFTRLLLGLRPGPGHAAPQRGG